MSLPSSFFASAISAGSITIENGAATLVTGDYDAVTLRANAAVTMSGTGDSVEVTGTGASATASNAFVRFEDFTGGTVAGCVWDFENGMEMLRLFWDAALAVDPHAPDGPARGPGPAPGS